MSTINVATINANKTSNVANATSRAGGGGTPAGFVSVPYAEPPTLVGTNSNDDLQQLVGSASPSGLLGISGNTLGDADIIRFSKDSLIQGKFNTNGDRNMLGTFIETCATGLTQDVYGNWLDPNGQTVNLPYASGTYLLNSSGDLSYADGDTYPGHFEYKSPASVTKSILQPHQF